MPQPPNSQNSKEGVSRPAILDQPRRSPLSLLDDIQIASPCSADWGEMIGDDRARHCGSCEKTVYDLSRLTAAQAEALLIEKEGALCVRLFRRSDGRVLTADCPVGLQAKLIRLRDVARGWRRFWWGALLAVCGAVGWLGSLFESTANAPSAKVPVSNKRAKMDMGKLIINRPRGGQQPAAPE